MIFLVCKVGQKGKMLMKRERLTSSNKKVEQAIWREMSASKQGGEEAIGQNNMKKVKHIP
jgi:hypothetical protein